MRLFKVLNDGKSTIQGYSWHKPKGKRPGKWMPPVEGELVACKNGYHLCREQDLIHWLNRDIYEAEYRGEEFIEADDKVVVREARLVRKLDNWNERTARLFACECAERVLPIYEKEYPDDNRPRKAIEVARLHADGKATNEELEAAREAAGAVAKASAREAAGAVAKASAWVAAWAAARAGAVAKASAWEAARDAAWEAARDAAWEAESDAAWAAEREWQTQRLMEILEHGIPEGEY